MDLEIDVDDLLSDNLECEQFLDQNEFTVTRKVDPADILTILILQLDILDILKEDLYCKTTPVNRRFPINQAFILPLPFNECWSSSVRIQPFYNQTSRMFFTEKSDALSSYLAICNDNLLRKLSQITSEEIIQEQFPNFDLNPICLFPLFKNMTIQERQAGIMVTGSKRWQHCALHILAPFYYLERNFFLTDQERKRVEAVFGAQDDTTFQDQHLISDKIGIGDTRFIFTWNILNRETIDCHLGMQAILPTACAFKKGLKGSSFKQWRQLRRCRFSIEHLWDLAQEDAQIATEYGTDFFLGALDTLAANLIDAELGNNRHPGLGIFWQSNATLRCLLDRPWADCIRYRGTFSLDYLFAKNERRFFLIKTNRCALNSNLYDPTRADEDPAYARCWLNLIENTFTNKFYPIALDAKIQPGVMLQWTPSFFFEKCNCSVQLGGDLWFQSAAKIKSIETPCDIGAQCLDLKKADPTYALQTKACAGFSYCWERPKRSWNVGLYGDYTFFSRGIGRDFTVAFNLCVDF